jgi:hypothetical protein
MTRMLGLIALVATIRTALAAGHIGAAIRHGGKCTTRKGESDGDADELKLDHVCLRNLRLRCEKAQIDRGGGVAGALTRPVSPAIFAGEGRSKPNSSKLEQTVVSPGMAAQGKAQVPSGVCFSEDLVGLLAQSIISDAAGVAAIAAVSQSGPSRTSSSAIRRASAMPRTSREIVLRRAITFPDLKRRQRDGNRHWAGLWREYGADIVEKSAHQSVSRHA